LRLVPLGDAPDNGFKLFQLAEFNGCERRGNVRHHRGYVVGYDDGVGVGKQRSSMSDSDERYSVSGIISGKENQYVAPV